MEDAAMPDDPEDVLGDRYRVIRRLGVGGMAAVFLAEDSVLARKVALKRLHAESAADAVRRFRREAELTAGLSHPNLVAVFDAFSEDEELVVVMEYVAGSDLSKAIATHEVTDDERRLRILADIAAALDHVHRAGILHRDVKPSNVLLAEDGSAAKLTDLGIARVMEETATTQTNAVPGSLAYMAPEQLAGEKLGPGTDIYSLALVAYELFTGQRARSGGWGQVSHEAVNEPPPNVREARPDFPLPAAHALEAGLARDPSERPATATALVDDLTRGLAARATGSTREATATQPVPVAPAEAPPATSPPSPPPAAPTSPEPVPARTGRAPARPAPSSARRRWLAVIAALVIAAVAAVLLLGGDGSEQSAKPQAEAPSEQSSKKGGQESVGESGAGLGPPEAAVKDFYEAAADGDFSAAEQLASPALEAQLGGASGMAATFSTLKSIDFQQLETSSESAGRAEVSFATTAVHTDRTENCTGTAAVVSSGGAWLVDELSGVSCDVTG
jgi:serine/threonine-protein kinase